MKKKVYLKIWVESHPICLRLISFPTKSKNSQIAVIERVLHFTFCVCNKPCFIRNISLAYQIHLQGKLLLEDDDSSVADCSQKKFTKKLCFLIFNLFSNLILTMTKQSSLKCIYIIDMIVVNLIVFFVYQGWLFPSYPC